MDDEIKNVFLYKKLISLANNFYCNNIINVWIYQTRIEQYCCFAVLGMCIGIVHSQELLTAIHRVSTSFKA